MVILFVVPSFFISHRIQRPEVRLIRAACDGHDPRRLAEEDTSGAALWTLTEGCFELRDLQGRHVMEPGRAILLPPGRLFTVRHPCGGDTCISFRGPVVETIAQRMSGPLTLPPQEHLRLLKRAAAFARGEDDGLALSESLVSLVFEKDQVTDRRSRLVAERIADRVRLCAAEPLRLHELAADSGVSVFHACRVFKRATGSSIHAFRLDLRLRRALARIIDGDEPLAEVALEAGFSSQAHLTSAFSARFGISPGRLRCSGR